MSEQNPFENTPIIYDLPEPLLGFPKVAIERVDAPTRLISYRFVTAEGVTRMELNTARFDGTYDIPALLADIRQAVEKANQPVEEAE